MKASEILSVVIKSVLSFASGFLLITGLTFYRAGKERAFDDPGRATIASTIGGILIAIAIALFAGVIFSIFRKNSIAFMPVSPLLLKAPQVQDLYLFGKCLLPSQLQPRIYLLAMSSLPFLLS